MNSTRIQIFLTWFKIPIKLIPIKLKCLITMIGYNKLAFCFQINPAFWSFNPLIKEQQILLWKKRGDFSLKCVFIEFVILNLCLIYIWILEIFNFNSLCVKLVFVQNSFFSSECVLWAHKGYFVDEKQVF